jgi:hypothetical protein
MGYNTRFLFRNRARTTVVSRERPSFQRGRIITSSYLIAVVHSRTSLSADDPHRISRRHLGLGGFLPRIEGPVLEAVERKRQGG